MGAVLDHGQCVWWLDHPRLRPAEQPPNDDRGAPPADSPDPEVEPDVEAGDRRPPVKPGGG